LGLAGRAGGALILGAGGAEKGLEAPCVDDEGGRIPAAAIAALGGGKTGLTILFAA